MTEDLAKKLKTTGAFDSPWLKEQLQNWNVQAEQRKADFMEHIYQCSGRAAMGPGIVGTYTGLWQDFCIKEAGAFARDIYFDRLEAVKEYQRMMEKEAKETEPAS
jgi:hypothetical protein